MLRFYFLSFVLFLVVTIGIPVDNPVTQFSYRLMRRLGIDVSMTPITFDMSMMTDEKGKLVYEKAFDLMIFSNGESPRVVETRDLDFYRHKVPINLYYEILGYGGIMPEGKTFMCRAFQEFSEGRITGFMLLMRKQDQAARGFNELQSCL